MNCPLLCSFIYTIQHQKVHSVRILLANKAVKAHGTIEFRKHPQTLPVVFILAIII